MKESEFKQIEAKLGLKLPAAYRTIMKTFSDDLREWPPLAGETATRPMEDFLLDAGEIIAAQKAARKRLGRALPKHSFVFGRTGPNFWLVDSSASDPPVQLLIEGLVLSGPASLAAHLDRVKSNHKEAWAKLRRRTESGAKANMTPDELIAHGRKMARPAVLLVAKGKECAAIWKGAGVVPPPEGDWEHWISIDVSYLPSNPGKRKGVVSVYLCTEDSERFHHVTAVHDPKGKLPAKTKGKRLFARPFQCVPPMEVLFKLGPKPVQDWLKANSVDPNHGINPQSFDAENRKALQAYGQVLAEEHPFYGNVDCFAMLGGWSMCFLWCYGIDQSYPWHVFDKGLVVLTIQDSEPWIEVFDDGKKFEAFSRIT